MKREDAHLKRNVISLEPCFVQYAKMSKLINQIFDEHEAQLKAKDEEIKELGEIVQQYLIPSKNYDAIIKAKDEEIELLIAELEAYAEVQAQITPKG